MNFIEHGIQVNQPGSNQQVVKCPSCSPGRRKHHLKTLSVNIEKGIWNCHHCGFSGSLTVFKVQDNFKYKKKAKVERIYKKPDKPKQSDYKIPSKVSKWFSDRKISEKTLSDCGVTYEAHWMPQTNKNENCIVFNYSIGNDLINKKYRDGKKNMTLEKDARLIMYAPGMFDRYQEADTIYITEGEPDSLAMIEIGFKDVLSTPNGAPPENVTIEEVNLSYLDSIDEICPNYKNVVLVMDSDKVGQRLRNEIARRLGIEKCYFVEYPKDCKDINDVLIKHGKDIAVKCINDKKQSPIAGKHSVEDMFSSVFNLYQNGVNYGLSTGWVGVDDLYTIKQKQFTIVTGIPSHGKSAWLDNLIINVAKRHKWKFAIYSPENFPFETHIAKLCEVFIGKPFHKNYNDRMNENELEAALKWLNEHFFFVMPEHENVGMSEVLDLCRKTILRHGVNGIIVDPWNEIEHNRGRMSETDYASKALSEVRKFSRVNDVHTWIVAHPTKLQKDKDGNYPPPTPYDISGSAHFRNKADNCICVHRDFEEGHTTIYIQKIRFKEIGKVGDVRLYFDLRNNRYTEKTS